MTIQQMMLGGYAPLHGSTAAINGSVFLNEPAPGTQNVSANGSAGAGGGTGSYTYAWSILSGGATISGSTTSASVTIQATVPKNTAITGTIRCTISDGVSSGNFDRPYSLSYTTDL